MTYTEYRKSHDYQPKGRLEEVAGIKKELCDLFWGKCPKEKVDELIVVPFDNPLLGTLGYVLYREESGEELSANIQVRFAGKVVEISYNNRDLFNDAFSKAWDSEKPLSIYDDPVRRLCGFIVDSRKGREWHYIRLSDYKS